MRVSRTFSAPQHASRRLRPQRRARRADRSHLHRGEHSQPQVAILGSGAVVKRPILVTDASGQDVIAIRSMVYLALSYDHRLVDGADAARFLGTMKARLEDAAFEAELGL